MFGSSWASQYPTEPLVILAKKEWATALVDVDLKQIKLAFQCIKQSAATFPPSLPKFLSYCRNDDNWRHRGGAYKKFVKALPKPLADRSVGRAALAGIRGGL